MSVTTTQITETTFTCEVCGNVETVKGNQLPSDMSLVTIQRQHDSKQFCACLKCLPQFMSAKPIVIFLSSIPPSISAHKPHDG